MVKKQFIAGAVCPACGAQDTIRVFRENRTIVSECVECGYTDTLSSDTSTQSSEMVNGKSGSDSDVQVVRIVDGDET